MTISNRVDALYMLLIDKGSMPDQLFFAKLNKVQAEYQKKSYERMEDRIDTFACLFYGK